MQILSPDDRAPGSAQDHATVLPKVLLATASSELAQRLREALAPVALLQVGPPDPAEMLARTERQRPSALLLDFTDASRGQSQALADAMRERGGPQLVAVGRGTTGADAIAALRANVHEFLEIEAAPGDLQQRLQAILQQPVDDGQGRKAPIIALLGARGGVGVSTIAANLAALLQRERAPRLLLADLGLPVGDSRTTLGVEPGISFAEAARSLERLDRTFVDSAIARSPQGIAVLPLPAQLQELREISHATATATLARLQQFFDALVLDLGGFTHTEFLLRVAAVCDHCLLVCDQSATAVVSTARLAGELAEREIAARILVNACETSLAPSPEQLAAHVKLPLAGVLPARYLQHLRALNEGRLLADSPNDPWSRALRELAARLVTGPAGAPAAASGWRARWQRLTQRGLA